MNEKILWTFASNLDFWGWNYRILKTNRGRHKSPGRSGMGEIEIQQAKTKQDPKQRPIFASKPSFERKKNEWQV